MAQSWVMLKIGKENATSSPSARQETNVQAVEARCPS